MLRIVLSGNPELEVLPQFMQFHERLVRCDDFRKGRWGESDLETMLHQKLGGGQRAELRYIGTLLSGFLDRWSTASFSSGVVKDRPRLGREVDSAVACHPRGARSRASTWAVGVGRRAIELTESDWHAAAGLDPPRDHEPAPRHERDRRAHVSMPTPPPSCSPRFAGLDPGAGDPELDARAAAIARPLSGDCDARAHAWRQGPAPPAIWLL